MEPTDPQPGRKPPEKSKWDKDSRAFLVALLGAMLVVIAFFGAMFEALPEFACGAMLFVGFAVIVAHEALVHFRQFGLLDLVLLVAYLGNGTGMTFRTVEDRVAAVCIVLLYAAFGLVMWSGIVSLLQRRGKDTGRSRFLYVALGLVLVGIGWYLMLTQITRF